MKKDPVIEKLDEILKTLKRIEAKPVVAPVFVPAPYYPPYYVQPHVFPSVPFYPNYPYFTWTAGSVVGNCNTSAYTNGQNGITFTNAQGYSCNGGTSLTRTT
jgi:hypothetical protein